jgi:hypothetical protein
VASAVPRLEKAFSGAKVEIGEKEERDSLPHGFIGPKAAPASFSDVV